MQRRWRTKAAAAAILLAALAGCGVAASHDSDAVAGHNKRAPHARRVASTDEIVLHGHPQAVDPAAGAVASANTGASGTSGSTASVNVSGDSGATSAAAGGSLQEPTSLTEVRQQLAESGISANPDRATLTPQGLAIAPINAPPEVQEIIAAANQIARLPYIWGGGHATYEDTGYDCSGSLSFILAAAGLLHGTETSGEFMSYGDPGPGKWMTIFAMNGHTFAYIAGLRFDTVAYAETGSRWSNKPADEPNLSAFVARHPPGL